MDHSDGERRYAELYSLLVLHKLLRDSVRFGRRCTDPSDLAHLLDAIVSLLLDVLSDQVALDVL